MRYLYTVVICLYLSVCGLLAQNEAGDSRFEKIAPKGVKVTESEDSHIIDAVQFYESGQYEQAIKILTKLIADDSENDAAYYYRSLAEIAINRLAEGEADLKKASTIDPHNFWYRYSLANYYAVTGKEELTIDIYNTLLRDYPKKTDLYYGLANLYIKQGQLDKALEMISSIEEQFGKSDATVMNKFSILRQAGKSEEAYKELENYNKEYSSPQVLTMLGDYEMGLYADSTALRYYDEALALDGDFAPAILGKAEVYRMTRKYPDYFAMLYELVSDRNVPAGPKSDYLQALVKESDPRFISSFMSQLDNVYEMALEVHPNDSTMLSCAGLYYFLTGRKDKSASIFHQLMNEYPESQDAVANYIQILVYSQDWHKVVEASDSAFAKFPSQPAFLEYASIAQYQLKNYSAVIANCEKAIKTAPGDSAVAVSSLTQMADMYHLLGESEKAYKAYDKVLKIAPDYAPALNNYAYYLSESGKKLKKAYTMSKKTVEVEPDNATYLDTFGWILYLQGKPLEAKPFFKHAMLYGGKDSAVVMEHYAAVLEALGEVDLAKVYRKQAEAKRAENGDDE